MGIALISMSDLSASARKAATNQWAALDRLRIDAAQLEVRPLPPVAGEVETLGVVAPDAGQVSVELAPFSLEFLYVADSRERVHLAEIFPLAALEMDLREIFERNGVLQRFAERIGLEWHDLSTLWARQLQMEQLFPRDVRLVADALRELAEWSVCAELAETEPRVEGATPSLLILHDGLLRSVLMRDAAAGNRLPAWWRDEAWRRKRVAIAGIGKTSLVWQRLALALDMDPRVQNAPECYAIVPPALEHAMTGRVLSGEERLGFGRLVLLKTRLTSSGYFLPVDVPEWILEDRAATDAVLGQIAHASQTTFPRPGYPAPLGKAHEAAHLTDFDAKVIRDQVVSALRDIVPKEDFERMLRAWALQPAKWEKSGGLGRP